MAEAFFRIYTPDGYEAISAGTWHVSQINPLAVETMKEVDIDISKQKPKEMTEDMIRNATKIINIGCMDKNFCPISFINKVSDLGIEDPKGKPIEKVVEIRNEIERKVKDVVRELYIEAGRE